METQLNKRKEVYKKYYSLNLHRFISDDDIKEDKRKKLIAYGAIVIFSLVNLFLGLIFNNADIISLSICLLIGFAVCFILTKYLKNGMIIDVIGGVTYCIIVTYFLLATKNYNYSILLILVAPTMIFSVMDYYPATFCNLYVLIFLFVVFYSPLNARYVNSYPKAFMYYFPIVYLIGFAISYYIYLKDDVNEKKSRVSTYIDELTDLGNRSYYNYVVKYMQALGLTNQKTIAVSLDVNGLKPVNDELGHSYGDELLKAAANAIKKSFIHAELIARIGGDEFVVITNESDEQFEESLKALDKNCEEYKNEKIKKLSISRGYAKTKEHPYVNPEKLYKVADEMMYKNKTQYYLENNIDRRKTEDN